MTHASAIGLTFSCDMIGGGRGYRDSEGQQIDPDYGPELDGYEVEEIADEDEFREKIGDKYGRLDAEFAVRVFDRTGRMPSYTMNQIAHWDEWIAEDACENYYDDDYDDDY